MTPHSTPLTPGYWRIVGAIAWKDIVEAIKNRTTLTMLIGLAIVMVSIQAGPLLLGLAQGAPLVLYDADRTLLVAALRRSEGVQARGARSAEDLQQQIESASGALVGISLPTGWQDTADPLTLTALVPYYLSASEVAAALAQVRRTLEAATGHPVVLTPLAVYPTHASGGRTLMVSLGLFIVLLMITTLLVPQLIVEEKTAHTLELLRVSPAGAGQIILGKGIAGLLYGFLAAAVLIAFNLALVVQWGLLVLAIAGGALFGVALGLLLGALIDNEQTMQLLLGLGALLIIMPTILMTLAMRDSGWTTYTGLWWPPSALFDLLRAAFATDTQTAFIVGRSAVLLVGAAALGWLNARLLRRREFV